MKVEILLNDRINEFKDKLELALNEIYEEEDVREYLKKELLVSINLETFEIWQTLCKMNIDHFQTRIEDIITRLISEHQQALAFFHVNTEVLTKHLTHNLMGFYAFSQCILFIDPSERTNAIQRMHNGNKLEV